MDLSEILEGLLNAPSFERVPEDEAVSLASCFEFMAFNRLFASAAVEEEDPPNKEVMELTLCNTDLDPMYTFSKRVVFVPLYT